VAALLPDAITRIEAAHGRRFAHSLTVGVYGMSERYAAANGLGSAVPMGVTFLGRGTCRLSCSGHNTNASARSSRMSSCMPTFRPGLV
jgi:hypothetical protein